jgi:hypothetical protein
MGMEYGSDYVVVFGRGLTQFNDEWQMSIDTQKRVEVALEYMDGNAVEGVFLLGGHSKWGPVPPQGITEAGLMLADIKDELDYGVPIYTDESMQSVDTFDNAINLAGLVQTHDVRLGDGDRLLFATGVNHYPRISCLSALAIGLSQTDAAFSFERIPVAEDSIRGAAKEAIGRVLLRPLLSDIEPGDTAELRKAQAIMDEWLHNKASVQTIRHIMRAMGLYAVLTYAGTQVGNHFSSQYEH